MRKFCNSSFANFQLVRFPVWQKNSSFQSCLTLRSRTSRTIWKVNHFKSKEKFGLRSISLFWCRWKRKIYPSMLVHQHELWYCFYWFCITIRLSMSWTYPQNNRLHRTLRTKWTYELYQKTRPTLVPKIIIHCRGPQESITTDLTRSLSANLNDFIPKSWTRLGAPPVSFYYLSELDWNCKLLISLPSEFFIT